MVKTIAIHLYGARDPNYIVDLTLSNLLWVYPVPLQSLWVNLYIVTGNCRAFHIMEYVNTSITTTIHCVSVYILYVHEGRML